MYFNDKHHVKINFRYWNPALRKEFLDKVLNYWTPDLIAPSRYEKFQNQDLAPKIVIRASEEQAKIQDNNPKGV